MAYRWHVPTQPDQAKPPTVLLVEDDATMREMVSYNLRRLGYAVEATDDGRRGLSKARSVATDLIILDVMLPNLDGIQIARELRRTRPDVPILMLTARTESEMKMSGFEAGVDDYLTKPFLMDELIARVKALMRRSRPRASASDEQPEIAFGDLRIATKDVRCWVDGHEIELRPKEFGLLAALAGEPGRLFSRAELAARVWGYGDLGKTRTIDTHIKTLRRKIEEHSSYRYLDTVRGAGYRFRVRPRSES